MTVDPELTGIVIGRVRVMLSLECIRLTTCVEEEKETEGTTEREHATGSYQMIQPQSRETSETVATLEEEQSQLQMTR